MPRPSNTAQRRRQIASGLMTAMATHGYERASIKEIAHAAGVTSGVIHYHFKSKQEILTTLVETLHETVLQRVDEASAHETPRDRVMALIDAHVGLGPGASREAVSCWVLIGAEAVTQPEVRAVYAQAIETTLSILHELLTTWIRDIGGDPTAATAASAALMAGIEGSYQLSTLSPPVLPEGYAAPALKEMATALVEASRRSVSAQKK